MNDAETTDDVREDDTVTRSGHVFVDSSVDSWESACEGAGEDPSITLRRRLFHTRPRLNGWLSALVSLIRLDRSFSRHCEEMRTFVRLRVHDSGDATNNSATYER